MRAFVGFPRLRSALAVALVVAVLPFTAAASENVVLSPAGSTAVLGDGKTLDLAQIFANATLTRDRSAKIAAAKRDNKLERRTAAYDHTCGHSTALSCGVTATGAHSATDCVETQGNTLFDLYTFQGTAGQAVRIEMSSTTVDTILVLFDQNAQEVAENDDFGAGTDSRIDVTLPSTGLYVVVAGQYERANGTYTIRVSGAGCGGGGQTCTPQSASLSCNQSLSGTLASTDCTLPDGAHYDVYTFTGTAGQAVTIDMTSSAFDTYLVLRNSS